MSASGPFPTGLITVFRWNPPAMQTTAEGRQPSAVSGLSASDAAIRLPRDHPASANSPSAPVASSAGRSRARAAGEFQRGEQVGPATVGHLGLPVGNHHRDTEPGHFGGQRLEDIPFVHADPVPQQRQRRGPARLGR